jgi:hypothetical protein
VTLYGLGGVGKTQLALQHAYSHESSYNSILWINANSKEDVELSIAKIAHSIREHCKQQEDDTFTKLARMLGLPDDQEALAKVKHGPAANLETVKKWLSINENRDWLVIIDNSDSLDANNQPWQPEKEFLPNRDAGSVIITTRLRDRGGLGKSIEVTQMDPAIGRRLLLVSAGMSDMPEGE